MLKETDVVVGARVVLPSECEFGKKAQVLVTVHDGGAEQVLFEFYHDELSFTADEFVHRSVEQGHKLFHQKDLAYLQS